MKKFLKSVLLFIPFAAVIYLALLLLWGVEFMPDYLRPNLKYRAGSEGHTSERLKEVKTMDDLDILFIGSSHAYRGFDTRIFEKNGLRVFNLGTSAQTPEQTMVLLNRYLDQLNPRLIIYEVYPRVFTNDGAESALDIIRNDANDIHSLRMALKINNSKVYNTLLYAVMQQALNSHNTRSKPVQNKKETYIRGGYTGREMTYFKDSVYPAGHWRFRKQNFAAFKKVLLLLKQKSKKLMLVYTPVTAGFNKSFSNNDEFDSIMHRSGYYINFNTRMVLNDSLHFMDEHHLNQRGVEIFNDSLIRLLKKTGLQ